MEGARRWCCNIGFVGLSEPGREVTCGGSDFAFTLLADQVCCNQMLKPCMSR